MYALHTISHCARNNHATHDATTHHHTISDYIATSASVSLSVSVSSDVKALYKCVVVVIIIIIIIEITTVHLYLLGYYICQRRPVVIHFVGWLVCLLTRLLKNLWTDYHET